MCETFNAIFQRFIKQVCVIHLHVCLNLCLLCPSVCYSFDRLRLFF